MRRIVHLSDLHFGRIDPAVLAALDETVGRLAPDVVVVSGDLTQRARGREFAAAHAFLAGLAFPKVVVPGNHDVPLFNLYRRAFHPLAGFRRFFGESAVATYLDQEVAIVGVSTARSLTFKNGRINREQVAEICRRLEPLDQGVTRIVVTHHPFHVEDQRSTRGVLGRAAMAMAGFARCRIDLILSGHLHSGQFALSDARYRQTGHSALLVQAGTATSVRRRGEVNSFNLIVVDWPALTVERWRWDDAAAGFAPSLCGRFTKFGGAWKAAP